MLRTTVAGLALLLTTAHAAIATEGPRTLVLPLRPVGVNEQTAHVSRDLLMGSLEDMGLTLIRPDSAPPLPAGAEACETPACAAALGEQHGASQVVYGSLSRLGGKLIARVNVLRAGESVPFYRDQLTATAEDDLDTVMRRFAEGIAAGRPNSDRASVESVTQAETVTPPRRATRAGFGVRAGFLFPTGNSFGGADRLTNIHGAWRTEFKDFMIETTPILGFSWGKGNLDWTMLDVSVARLFGTQDLTTYLGAGLGVHSVRVERRETITTTYPGPPPFVYTYEMLREQSETAPTLDLVAGVMALRTYDFSLIIELRYHYVFARFDELGGDGAQGVRLTFGTSR